MDGATALQESTQFMLAGGGKTVERLEVLCGPTGRRNWPDAIKARIVAESFETGTRVIDVARRYGISPQQVTTWRRQARQGRLAIPVEDDAAFARLLVEEPHPPASPGSASPPIEIEADGVIVRLAGDVSAARVAEIAVALRAAR
jgi:transposase